MDDTKFVERFKNDTEANDFWVELTNKPYYAEIIYNIKALPSTEESQTFLNKVKLNHQLKRLEETKNCQIDMLKKQLEDQKYENENRIKELHEQNKKTDFNLKANVRRIEETKETFKETDFEKIKRTHKRPENCKKHMQYILHCPQCQR
jgi:hypothetical protein